MIEALQRRRPFLRAIRAYYFMRRCIIIFSMVIFAIFSAVSAYHYYGFVARDILSLPALLITQTG